MILTCGSSPSRPDRCSPKLWGGVSRRPDEWSRVIPCCSCPTHRYSLHIWSLIRVVVPEQAVVPRVEAEEHVAPDHRLEAHPLADAVDLLQVLDEDARRVLVLALLAEDRMVPPVAEAVGLVHAQVDLLAPERLGRRGDHLLQHHVRLGPFGQEHLGRIPQREEARPLQHLAQVPQRLDCGDRECEHRAQKLNSSRS